MTHGRRTDSNTEYNARPGCGAALFRACPRDPANFVGLADGSKPWRHPETGATDKGPLYKDTIFHRVIDGFMIQGGDPLGTGQGGPGYEFKDEFHPAVTFNRSYLLAMANAGPGTNGSQFFITVGPTPHLTNRHTIFGEVVQGQEVVDAIATSPTGRGDRPLTDITIQSVTIGARANHQPWQGNAADRGPSGAALVGVQQQRKLAEGRRP